MSPAEFHNLNPAIPGFHPDPTMCAGPDAVYLANSSFELFPGGPVFRSKDLAGWEQIGNVLHRTDQLDLGTFNAPSSGIYGSTLRFRAGRFWFVTTNIAQAGEGQLIFTADDPAGPWSDPVVVRGATGIDPDLSWDDDGTCRLTWCWSGGGIAQVTVDPVTGEVLSERRHLWSGTGMKAPEGPHLFHVGDWWYLLIAEGGTERGHCVSVARSRRPDGGFEPHPGNPILTHRSTGHPVQSVGHADLVEWNGRWWACYHGTRPQGYTPEFHVLGRETMVCPVEWVDGWPVFREDLAVGTPADTSLSDDFSGPLGPHWVSPNGTMAGVESGDGALLLTAGDSTARPVGIRVQDLAWTSEATLDVTHGVGRLVVHLDDDHTVAVEADEHRVVATGRSHPFVAEFGRATVADPSAVCLRISVVPPTPPTPGHLNGPDEILLQVVDASGVTTLAGVDGRHLSTEVAAGFTGRTVGVQAVEGTVRVTGFTYRPTPDVSTGSPT